MLAYQVENLKSLPGDGVVGLAPNSVDGTISIVTELYNQDVISQNMFTLFLSKRGLESKAWFGGYDLEYVRKSLTQFYYESEINKMSD